MRELIAAMDIDRDDQNPETAFNVVMEAADVANFCMMIADNCGGLKP
jgi:hypothetical protein